MCHKSHQNLTNSKTGRQYNVSTFNFRARLLKFKKNILGATQNVLKR